MGVGRLPAARYLALVALSCGGGGTPDLAVEGQPQPVPPCNRAQPDRCRQMCDGGDLESCSTLADLHQFGSYGVEADDDAARRLYTRACDGGFGRACTELARMDITSTGSGDSAALFARAEELHRAACGAGSGRDCVDLGQMALYNTVDTEAAERGALALYRQACDMGYGGGCLAVGRGYEGGMDILAWDREAAAKWYRTGCELDFQPACYFAATTVDDDAARAADMTALCDAGSALACEFLGDEHARAPDADPSRSTELWQRGCDLGNERACAKADGSYGPSPVR